MEDWQESSHTQPDPAPAEVPAEVPAESGAESAGEVPAGLERLHPRAVGLWRLTGLLRAGMLAAGVLAADLFLTLPVPAGLAPALVALGAVLHAVFFPPLRYRAWSFTLREQDLLLRYGVLFRTTSIVPHARIQHVDTRHGPVDRWLGLAEVVVFTAGTRGAVLSIPALGRPEAEALRDRLAALSGAGDAV
jgi:uncharacterized protein